MKNISERKCESQEDFDEFKNFAKNTNDNELMGKVKIVEMYTNDLPDYIAKIKRRCNCPENLADYVFTTTHKAKGLEWKTVILLDDFIEVTNGIMSDRIKSDGDEDEDNILYVAMTRAKEYLAINFSVFDLLVSSGETFDKIVHMKLKKLENHSIPCMECHDDIVFEENVLGLESRQMNLNRLVFTMESDEPALVKVTKHPGMFCSVCATSQKFKDSGINGSSLRANRFMKNRIFLRFLTGKNQLVLLPFQLFVNIFHRFRRFTGKI